MTKKNPKILSLTAALAALSGTATDPNLAAAKTPDGNEAKGVLHNRVVTGEPNVFFSVANDLLGLIVRKAEDGTVVVDHYSHASHASHSSHHSHYSSR